MQGLLDEVSRVTHISHFKRRRKPPVVLQDQNIAKHS